MTPKEEAEKRIHKTLSLASRVFEYSQHVGPSEDCVAVKVDAILESQGLEGVPAALSEYWRRAGAQGKGEVVDGQFRRTGRGIWSEFARCGGFNVDSAFGSRMVAIEVALSAGWDWQRFRMYEPLVTFADHQGGAVYWCPFDPDEPDHDPPVWTLSEAPGSEPVKVASKFSDYISRMVAGELAMRAHEELYGKHLRELPAGIQEIVTNRETSAKLSTGEELLATIVSPSTLRLATADNQSHLDLPYARNQSVEGFELVQVWESQNAWFAVLLRGSHVLASLRMTAAGLETLSNVDVPENELVVHQRHRFWEAGQGRLLFEGSTALILFGATGELQWKTDHDWPWTQVSSVSGDTIHLSDRGEQKAMSLDDADLGP